MCKLKILDFGTAFHNGSFAIAGHLPQDNYHSEGIACLTALRPTILKKYHFIDVSQMFTQMLPSCLNLIMLNLNLLQSKIVQKVKGETMWQR
jgi:hypothetical protein